MPTIRTRRGHRDVPRAEPSKPARNRSALHSREHQLQVEQLLAHDQNTISVRRLPLRRQAPLGLTRLIDDLGDLKVTPELNDRGAERASDSEPGLAQEANAAPFV